MNNLDLTQLNSTLANIANLDLSALTSAVSNIGDNNLNFTVPQIDLGALNIELQSLVDGFLSSPSNFINAQTFSNLLNSAIESAISQSQIDINNSLNSIVAQITQSVDSKITTQNNELDSKLSLISQAITSATQSQAQFNLTMSSNVRALSSASSASLKSLNSSINDTKSTLATLSKTQAQSELTLSSTISAAAVAFGNSAKSLSSGINILNNTITTFSATTSESLTSLKSSIDGQSATVQDLKQTTATLSNGLVSLTAVAKVLTVVNGVISGWENINDGTTSTFNILANNFTVSSGSSGLQPFGIVGNNIQFNGVVNFSNVTGAPIIPTNTSQLTNNSGFATTNQIPTALSQLTNNIGFATTNQIPTALSQLTNNIGFITAGALNGYASTTWVNQQGFILPQNAAAAINSNSTTINGSMITTGTIQAAQIAAGAITASQITAGTITADRIVLGSLGANMLIPNNLAISASISYNVYNTWSWNIAGNIYVPNNSSVAAKVLVSVAGRTGITNAQGGVFNFNITANGAQIFVYGESPSNQDSKCGCGVYTIPANSGVIFSVNAAQSNSAELIAFAFTLSVLGVNN